MYEGCFWQGGVSLLDIHNQKNNIPTGEGKWHHKPVNKNTHNGEGGAENESLKFLFTSESCQISFR